MFLSVAICTRNRSAFLSRAVESVLPQLAGDSELVVVDNASTDDTPRIVRTFAMANPKIIAHTESRLGLSIARNAALNLARGRFILFLDDDATAEPGWLDAYRTFLSGQNLPPVGVIGGAVIPNFEVPPPSWLKSGIKAYDLGREPQRILEHRGPWGCNIGYDRNAAIKVGMFNEKLGRKGLGLGAHEELDLNLRLEQAGYEIWWVPNAAVRHFVGKERLRLKWEVCSEFGQSRSRVVMKLRSMQKTRQRCLFRAGRILVSPFQCLAHLIVGAAAFAVRNEIAATNAVLRFARSAGVACESLTIRSNVSDAAG